MKRNQIILYGLSGVDAQYVAIEYQIVDNHRGLTIKNRWRYLRGIASFMMCNDPSIEHVYAIYNRKGLAQEYRDSAFDKHNSIESRYAFKDMLEREGELVI